MTSLVLRERGGIEREQPRWPELLQMTVKVNVRPNEDTRPKQTAIERRRSPSNARTREKPDSVEYDERLLFGRRPRLRTT